MQDQCCAWEHLIGEELLKTKLVAGVALVTHQGEPVYTYGTLATHISPDTWRPFTTAFERATPKHDEQVCNAGFTIDRNKEKKHFKVIRKTLCSLYGTSEGGMEGLVVCNLPYGVLICLHRQPDCAGQVISAVERFADMIRA